MQIIDALFCDDIRLELNNKLSLIGLYTDSILVIENTEKMQWPLPLRLAVLLRFNLEEKDNAPSKFEFEYLLNDKTIMTVNGEIKRKNSFKKTNLIIKAEGIPLEPGRLGFLIHIYDKKDKKIFSVQNDEALKITTEQTGAQ